MKKNKRFSYIYGTDHLRVNRLHLKRAKAGRRPIRLKQRERNEQAAWLQKGARSKETKGTIMAAQDLASATNWRLRVRNEQVLALCRMR